MMTVDPPGAALTDVARMACRLYPYGDATHNRRLHDAMARVCVGDLAPALRGHTATRLHAMAQARVRASMQRHDAALAAMQRDLLAPLQHAIEARLPDTPARQRWQHAYWQQQRGIRDASAGVVARFWGAWRVYHLFLFCDGVADGFRKAIVEHGLALAAIPEEGRLPRAMDHVTRDVHEEHQVGHPAHTHASA